MFHFNTWVYCVLTLAGGFPGAGSEIVTLKEGEDLRLNCTLSSNDSSALQWINPHGFVIFLNNQRGKCENWSQNLPRGAGGSLRSGFSLLPPMASLTQPLEVVLGSALAGSKLLKWKPPWERSGTRAFSCSYHQHQEISTKTHPCLKRERRVDVPESPGCSSAHQGTWCSASRGNL